MHFVPAARSLPDGAWGARMLTQPLQEDVESASSTQRLLAIDRRRHDSPWRHLLEVVTDEMRWDERHRLLDAHPFFRGCSRQEIRRIARMGDFIEIDAGQLLWRKWQIGYWFLVLFSGAVELRDAAAVKRIEPGGTLGTEAILSFGPQRETAQTVETVVAFVVGRRHLLSLADNPMLRTRLGLPRDATTYVEHLRRLRSTATSEWRHVPPHGRARIKPEHFPANFRIYERHSSSAALEWSGPAVRVEPPPVAPLSPRVVAALVAGVLSLVAAVFLLYKPPVAVVRAGAAVDVLGDIDVAGAPTYPVSGRYLLLTVHFDRPSLAGLIVAKVAGERTVSLISDDTSGETAYRNSRTAAISYAALAAGLEIDDLDAEIRDRQLSGPSAGLVYGLALRDLLDPEDHTRGRTVAVTGGINRDGDVYPVWFVREKSGVVRKAGADVFIVPAGQHVAAGGAAPDVIGVRTVTEAQLALERALNR
jgi:PDZ domain-containing protein